MNIDNAMRLPAGARFQLDEHNGDTYCQRMVRENGGNSWFTVTRTEDGHIDDFDGGVRHYAKELGENDLPFFWADMIAVVIPLKMPLALSQELPLD